MIKVTYIGYNENKEKMELVCIGELLKETEKQIRVKQPLEIECVINKSKIISREDNYILKEVEVVEEPFDYKVVANDYNDYVELCENIRESESSALQNFFDIGCYLNEINDRKLYLLEDYLDIYEFALNKFGYKNSSVNNFINVLNKIIQLNFTHQL